MTLNDSQLKELEGRCDAALKRATFPEQMTVMDGYLDVDHKTLPEPLRIKFCKVLTAMTVKKFAC
jgi:hypothetical protein